MRLRLQTNKVTNHYCTTTWDIDIEFFAGVEDGSPQQESVDPLAKRLDFGVEPSALTREQHGTRYISLPNMRLAVVFEKFWLAILHKNKLVEFRSSKHPTLLESGQCLLFALAMRHRRNGKESLVIARVSRVELLLVDTARKRYPREAEHCRLPALAAKWGVTFVRCIVLDSHSIRIADEIVNLSRGCLGIIHQFALKTGEPHFCHVSDLGKTVSFTRSDSKIVYPIFRRPLSLHAYDSTPIECSAGDTTIIGETSNAGGSSAGAGNAPAPHHLPPRPLCRLS